MKIQLFSDFHLENRDIVYPIPKADILILAGDVCQFDKLNSQRAFFMYLNLNWKKVIWILGNHEYYSKSTNLDVINTYIKGFISLFPNILILDRNIIEIDNYRIMGCTLWSKISQNSEHLCTNAFKHMHIDNRNITREEYNKMHSIDKQWLLNNYDPNRDTIIITHFPTKQNFTVDPKYNNDSQDIKNVYTNDLYFKPNNKKLICLSGHTHYNFNKSVDGVKYRSNQYGNQLEASTFYDTTGLIEF
tara:strand:- start:110 stop:847 length:738 start_codon:yes stop_codon:yes gene_type:complete